MKKDYEVDIIGTLCIPAFMLIRNKETKTIHYIDALNGKSFSYDGYEILGYPKPGVSITL